MTFPEWTKPGIYGALAGAIGISLLGFSFAGWTTGGNAKDMAESFAKKEVTLAMVPICLDRSAADPERIAKLATIDGASSFSQRKAMMDTGWATMPGAEAPSGALAEACIEGLNLDGS